jgi:beta-lactamase class A
MATDMRTLTLGSAPSSASRELLTLWLKASRTGETCLRAGIPPSWTVGDKTGLGGAHNATGDSDTRNDVAIAWPPSSGPLVIAAYLTGCKLAAVPRDAVLARVARIATTALRG